jgi:hypothetical protein
MSAANPRRSPGRTTISVVTGIAALQALMVIAFAWPAAHTAPRDVPLVVSGPAAAVASLTAGIERSAPGAFDIAAVPDATAAEAALRDRDAYGAVLVEADGSPRVLVASAASAQVTQTIEALGRSLNGVDEPVVQDVVPASADDPRGGTLGAGLLPLVMTSVVAGALLTLLVRSNGARLAGLVGLSVVGGAVVGFIDHVVLGGIEGAYLADAAVIGLMVLAISSTVVGIAVSVGRIGIPVTALVMMLLGNPLSGATSAPEMLPQPWGAFGQLLPPGAGASALRSVAFFDGAGAGSSLAVLTAWSVLGLGLLGVATMRSRRATASGQRSLAAAPSDGRLPETAAA